MDPVTQPHLALFCGDHRHNNPLLGAGHPGGGFGHKESPILGSAFRDAYCTFGNWSKLVAILPHSSAVPSFEGWWADQRHRHQTRRLEIILESGFHKEFLGKAPAKMVYMPSSALARFAWARQGGVPNRFALCGAVLDLPGSNPTQAISEHLTAPLEPYDSLVCASSSEAYVVKSLMEGHADFLRECEGIPAALRARIAVVSPGINPDTCRPPTSDERGKARKSLGIAADEIVVLNASPLSLHRHAHPFPMLQGLSLAAQKIPNVHLILTGQSTNERVRAAIRQGWQQYAPSIRLTEVDAGNSEKSGLTWDAADLYTELSDSVGNEIPLRTIEAMARGLPVVASDWPGHRDVVVHEQTGFLIPTYHIEESTGSLTSRLLLGEIGLDQFLAEYNQTVAVDCGAAGDAYRRLFEDSALRQRMGAAGRNRAVASYSWEKVIHGYESLWREQEAERANYEARRLDTKTNESSAIRYPAVDVSFAGYPTQWLNDDDVVQTALNGIPVRELLTLPITNYLDSARITDVNVLDALLKAAAQSCTIAKLAEVATAASQEPERVRPTLAWLLKYGLLCRVGKPAPHQSDV